MNPYRLIGNVIGGMLAVGLLIIVGGIVILAALWVVGLIAATLR